VSAGVPPAEVDVTDELVRALLAAQCPELAGLPLRRVANGWDNVMYRLGDRHAVRIPRRRLAAPLVEHEQRWLPVLAPHLPVPVPVPLHAGRPQDGYPWCWSVTPWLDGVPAATRLAGGGMGEPFARALAAFAVALHQPAPSDAPHNPFRGGPPMWIHGAHHHGPATWERARAFALSMVSLFRSVGEPGSPEEAIAAFGLRQLLGERPAPGATGR